MGRDTGYRTPAAKLLTPTPWMMNGYWKNKRDNGPSHQGPRYTALVNWMAHETEENQPGGPGGADQVGLFICVPLAQLCSLYDQRHDVSEDNDCLGVVSSLRSR